MVDLGRTSIDAVIESLLGLLEDLARPYATVAAHPSHFLQSEVYILSLCADSCAGNWTSSLSRKQDVDDHDSVPEGLEPRLVSRMFDLFEKLLEPIPDDYILPAEALLGQVLDSNFFVPRPESISNQTAEAECLEDCLVAIDSSVKILVEFITASSWTSAFDYVRNAIYKVRTTSYSDGGAESQNQSQDSEVSALIALRLLSFFWVDGPKLGQVIQEICSSYLHFRKSCQCTIAAVIPLLVTRWIDRCPDEFVRLHLRHRRLDGGADTLFDMTQTGIDNGRRRAVLYPLQMALLLLLPDVFEVASNLREAKSNNLIKKVSFLDGLRKALRNGNERAAYCLVTLLRAARHFELESDAALVSFAMDVQDEVRDSVFTVSQTSPSSMQFEQDMVTAAFVSLVYLDLDGCVEALTNRCMDPLAPDTLKIAVIQACSYFAREPQPERFTMLHEKALPFIQSEFQVKARKSTFCTFSLLRNKIVRALRYERSAKFRHSQNRRDFALFGYVSGSSCWRFVQPVNALGIRKAILVLHGL